MVARDANDATWYVLRYEEDFLAPVAFVGNPGAPLLADSYPWLDDTLFYDGARHVLELLPEPLHPERVVRPPPGLAVDVDGTIYRVDPRTGALRIVFCDGSDRAFPCEPQVLARPAGIALDGRGYIVVADPAAKRVVVLSRDDGSVQLVLGGGLVEPVDVAVGFDGRFFVADRGAGRIEVYSRRGVHLGGFAARNGDSLPATPSPIAVMIDADGTVLVADAAHPRLLRFSACGEPLADAQLTTLAAALAGGDVALDALHKAYGLRAPRFISVACCPLGPDDGVVRLAAVHRALRVLRLVLDRRYEPTGTFLSRRLDGGVPGTTWHRIELDADLPPATSIVVEVATSDDATPLALAWAVPTDADGDPIPFAAGAVLDHLIQAPPGRYAWLRVTLAGDGTATPTLRSIRVTYPRVSYLELLPAVYRRDPDGARFTERFLALFERVFTGIEDRWARWIQELDPKVAPRDVIDWLAALIDLAFDPSWPLAKRQALVGEAMELYALRGTPRGIARYVEIYTGIRPVVVEGFLERPHRPALLGRPATILGCSTPLIACSAAGTPEDTLYGAYAHRFRVYAYLDDKCDEPVVLAVLNRIVEVQKPAHTVHEVCVVYPGAELGITTSVGIGLVLGAHAAPALRLSTVLGDETVLK